MKRPAFFIALAVLAGAVFGRVALVPLPLSAGAVVAFLSAAVVLARRKPAPRAGRSPESTAEHLPGSALERLSEGAAERSPDRFVEHARPGRSIAAIRLALAAVFCLALLQQNIEVRKEQLADQMLEGPLSRAAVLFEGVLATEPMFASDGERLILVLKNVEIRKSPRTSASDTARGSSSPSSDSSVGLSSASPSSGEESFLVFPSRVQVSLLRKATTDFGDSLPVQGQRLEIAATLRRPPEAVHLDLFDYRAYLRSRGIGATASVWDPAGVRRISEQDRPIESAFFRVLMQWRRATLDSLSRLLPIERAAIARAIVLGDTSHLDRSAREDFMTAGVAHIFAVSGLHTTMLAALVFGLCRLLQIPPRASTWILFAFLGIYCVLVGFLAPVVRGTVMACCLALPFVTRRAVDSLNALCIAAAGSVLVDPLAPLRTDFQFSYLCAFGLIALTPTLSECFRLSLDSPSYARRRLVAFHNLWIGNALAVTIAAQVAVLPLVALYFHRMPLIGFVANLVLVPYSSLVLAAACLFSLCGSISPDLAAMFGPVLSALTGLFIAIIRFFASFSWTQVFLPTFPVWLMGIYYILIFTGPHMQMLRAPAARETRRAGLILRIAAVAGLVAWWPVLTSASFFSGDPANGLQFTMLDVGQGDCFILRSPDDETIVVDTGRKQAVGTILDYLRSRGIDEIQALVLTHGDSDHSGAAPEILERYFVKRLVLGEGDSDKGLEETLAAAKRRGVPVSRVHRGDSLSGSQSLRLDILNPPLPSGTDSRVPSDNESSVVLLAEYGETTFLLMGDAGTDVEDEICRDYGRELAEVEILKAGHHGSARSTGEDFVRAIRPEIALLSVSARNSYGHPAPGVVERLEGAGALVLSTAVTGSADLLTDGKRIWVRVAKKAEKSL